MMRYRKEINQQNGRFLDREVKQQTFLNLIHQFDEHHKIIKHNKKINNIR